MTEAETKRVSWHLGVAVCRTKRGVRTHLGLFSLDELKLLCRRFNCSANEIVDRMYAAIKKCKQKQLT